jgi:hypothetical protein
MVCRPKQAEYPQLAPAYPHVMHTKRAKSTGKRALTLGQCSDGRGMIPDTDRQKGQISREGKI